MSERSDRAVRYRSSDTDEQIDEPPFLSKARSKPEYGPVVSRSGRPSEHRIRTTTTRNALPPTDHAYTVRSRSFERPSAKSPSRPTLFRELGEDIRPPVDRKYRRPPSPAASGTPAPVVINNYVYVDGSSDDDASSDNSDDHDRAHGRRRSRRRRRNKSPDNDAEWTRGERGASSTRETSGAHGVLSRRSVNAIWDPSQKTDLTIHLKLPVQEDLDEYLEEFCRLRRLGDFDSAEKFFAQNLNDHRDNPYVLVQYAEMLLEQNNYNGLMKLEESTIFDSSNPLLENDEGQLLITYWRLIHVERARWKPPVNPDAFNVIPEAMKRLHHTISANEGQIGSTQIRMFLMLLDMARSPDNANLQVDWITRHFSRLFPIAFLRRLYASLLRQGRIWDFHDLFSTIFCVQGHRSLIWVFFESHDIRTSLETMLDDWRAPTGGYDTPTALALLDLLVTLVPPPQLNRFNDENPPSESIMAMAAPLAHSVMDADPAAMSSRPFLNWMLKKTEYALMKDPTQANGLNKHLEPQPGIFRNGTFGLPKYVPAKSENPGWRPDDAAPQYTTPVRMVISTAKRLKDYPMYNSALTTLIRLLRNPLREFDELQTVQLSLQGNMSQYSETLVSKFLALAGDSSNEKYKTALRDICSDTAVQSCLTPSDRFYLYMLLYSMEGEGLEAERLLESALDCTKYMVIGDAFDEKLPHLRHKRLDHILKTTTSYEHRKYTELQINMFERLRESQGLSEFPEIDIDERDRGDTLLEAERSYYTSAAKRNHRAEETFPTNSNKNHNEDSDSNEDPWRRRARLASRQTRETITKRGQRERPKQRNESERLRAQRQELQRVQRELELLKAAQAAEKAQESRLVVEREERERIAAQKQLEEMRLSKERAEMEEMVRQKMEIERMREDAKTQAENEQRQRVEREAVEAYQKEVAERALRQRHEKELTDQLNDLRTGLEELKAQVALPEPDHEADTNGPSGLIPARSLRHRVWRVKRHRPAPRIFQVDPPSSSDSACSGNEDDEDADERRRPREAYSSSEEEIEEEEARRGLSPNGEHERSMYPSVEEPEEDHHSTTDGGHGAGAIDMEQGAAQYKERQGNEAGLSKDGDRYQSGHHSSWKDAHFESNGLYRPWAAVEEVVDGVSTPPTATPEDYNGDSVVPSDN